MLISKTKAILFHILGIIAFIVYEVALLLLAKQPFNVTAVIVFYILNITWFYYTSLHILPALHQAIHKTIWIGSMVLVCIFCFSILLIYTGHGINAAYFGKFTFKISFHEFFRNFWRSGYITLLALCFWYARYSIQKVREVQKSKMRELELENAFLRSHINPHLMFNSLTHLYENMLEHAPQAAAPVMTMAEMMRYALDTNQPESMATLKEEMEHINRLINLYQLTENGTACIQFTNAVKNENKVVPPMLFNHFVENVLMYGVLNDPDHPAIIDLRENGGNIIFRTRNKTGKKVRKGHNTGFIHTRKRLENYYLGKHELTVRENDDEFIVELRLMT